MKVVKSYSGKANLTAHKIFFWESSNLGMLLHSLLLSTAALSLSLPVCKQFQNIQILPTVCTTVQNGPEKATCGVVGEATRRDLPTGDHKVELLGSTESLTAIRPKILPSVGCAKLAPE